MGRDIKRHTVERCYLYHLYYIEGRYFVDYYNSTIIHSYATESAARESIKYHFE